MLFSLYDRQIDTSSPVMIMQRDKVGYVIFAMLYADRYI